MASIEKRLEALEALGLLRDALPTKEQIWDMTDYELVAFMRDLGPPFFDLRSLTDSELDEIRFGNTSPELEAKLRSLEVPHFRDLRLENSHGTN